MLWVESVNGTLPSQIGVATAFLLSAIGGSRGQAAVALAAYHSDSILLIRNPLEFLVPDVATSKPEHQMQRRLLLDIVVAQGPPVLKLLPGEYQPLLVRRDIFFVLDLRFHIVNCVAALHLEGDRLSG
ncbi:hypothetical protein LUZ63_000972 [Rhynchospora breviuscula]|uniref:Uncharacterized protein n=1 Tax=Rhynchospora breviuscula TaxID=2022672 RepID=A0A9Q0CWF5_9POAL|nr:hypothetical protein LUZ63_000972 [Rhynchospora breviuscula]